MTLFGLIGFTTPWLLLGLLALPVLWIILRAVPPAPIRRMFPGVVLLLGLKDEEQVTDRTPWWLLLLRMLAVAAVIVGLAGPVLNPDNDNEAAGDGPLLVVMDASWASAADWRGRMIALDGLLAEAGRNSRPVAVMRLTDPQEVQFLSADVLRTRLSGILPEPWQPSDDTIARAIELLPEDGFDTYWMSDALAREGREALLTTLEARGTVTVFEAPRTLYALEPAQISEGNLLITARRLREGPEAEVTLAGHGKDPAGNPAVLTRNTLTFEAGMMESVTEIALPAELRARIERFEIEGARSAGAVTLPDDSLRRREVALIAGSTDREGLELLSPLHYIEKALEPSADLLDGALLDILPANLDARAPARRWPQRGWRDELGGTQGTGALPRRQPLFRVGNPRRRDREQPGHGPA